jgi:hypothetical protein
LAVSDGRLTIHRADAEVVVCPETTTCRQRITDPAYFHGVAGPARLATAAEGLRPLTEYEPV